ncbi:MULTISPECIES: GPP34 family phosphoprotein [unclassified Streptomyces]|uniref:GOLPH3/VPS74 family protein n=1 Tax=unclassified Streptomyces TaxID=2593676 RepID=UPI0004C7C4ED|nr:MULTISPECIES: GPP34 family phosphoprotein [unclassified Streptomyces]
MSLAQDLALLLLDDESGRTTIEVGRRHRAVGTAVLLDLVRAGRITIETPQDRPAGSRAVVTDTAPTGDPVLDEALTALSAKEKSLSWAAETIGHRSWRPLLEGLVEQGHLRHEQGRFLGVIRTNSWPSADPAHEDQVLARIRGALADGEQPDEPTALLITILHAIGALAALLPGEDKKTVGERAERIIRETEQSGPWREALQGFNSALLAVLLAS